LEAQHKTLKQAEIVRLHVLEVSFVEDG